VGRAQAEAAAAFGAELDELDELDVEVLEPDDVEPDPLDSEEVLDFAVEPFDLLAAARLSVR
jgi:hypothetical protein